MSALTFLSPKADSLLSAQITHGDFAPMYVVHEPNYPFQYRSFVQRFPTRFGSPLIATGEGRIIDASPPDSRYILCDMVL
jgi:hypothetical protein